MFGSFDLGVVVDSLPYLFYTGMSFTLTLTNVSPGVAITASG